LTRPKPSSDQGFRSAGRELDPLLRLRMELALGQDLSRIRVHDEPWAARSASDMAANAYAVGRHIVFASGRYSPGSSGGDRLLKHELIHAVQQGQVDAPARPDLIDDPASEGEAKAGSASVDTPFKTPYQAARVGVARDAADDPVPSRLELLVEIEALTRQAQALGEKGETTPELARVRARLATLQAVVAADDPVRQIVILHRGRLAELRAQLAVAPMSSAREPIVSNIRREELLLQRALAPDIARLEAKVTSLQGVGAPDPTLQAQLLAAEADLREDWAEQEALSRIFSEGKATAVRSKYFAEVRELPGGGCMTAVYKGFEALYTTEESAAIKKQVQADAAEVLKKTKVDTNNVDRIMETMRMHGKTGPEIVIKYSARVGRWVPKVEDAVLGMVKPEYPGWYFFGLSVSGGWHSVILAVDNSQGGPAQVYWMDQYARGFTAANNKTGRVDTHMKEEWLHPTYDFTDSRVWPLMPTPETVIPVEVK